MPLRKKLSPGWNDLLEDDLQTAPRSSTPAGEYKCVDAAVLFIPGFARAVTYIPNASKGFAASTGAVKGFACE